MESDTPGPRRQLADLERHRATVADRLTSPWWLHAGYGALLVGLGLVTLLAPPWGEHVGYAGFVGGWVALASWQVRRADVLYRGWRTPGAWAWGALMLAVVLAGLVVALGAHSLGAVALAVSALVITGVGASLLSWKAESALRAQVRRAP